MECQVKQLWKSTQVDLLTIGNIFFNFSLKINYIIQHWLNRAAEGKTVQIAYKGSIQSTIQDILGGEIGLSKRLYIFKIIQNKFNI